MDLSLNNNLLISLLITVAVSLLLWWYVYRSQKVLLDHQQQRSLHQGQAVTGGGALIFLPLSLVGIWLFPGIWPFYMILLLCLLGWADDRFDLSFQLRLLIQVMAASITLYYFGFSIGGLMFWFLLLSLLWWVNLFNFMDGANGMAGLHALVGVGFYLWLLNDSAAMTFMASTAMLLLLVYLLFNLGLNKLFMGDSGSLPLALLLAVLALHGVANGYLSLAQVAVIHAVFITDATLTLFDRIHKKERITQAHASHLYQRLIKNGAAHGWVSGGYAVLTVGCGLAAWFINGQTWVIQTTGLLSIYLILLMVFMKTLNTGR